MSRKLFAILTLIISLLLTSCSLEDFDFLNIFFQSDAAIAKQTTEQLMSAIERHDTNSIKDVFAKTVVDNAYDFEESVSALMDYYTGNMVSCNSEYEPYSSGVYTPERTCEYIYCSYSVTTDKSDYYFYLKIMRIISEYIHCMLSSKVSTIIKTLFIQVMDLKHPESILIKRIQVRKRF